MARRKRGPVQAYLEGLDSKSRAALERIRRAVLSVAPEAEEATTYGMPGFKLNGKAIASFAVLKDHLSFFPMSGTVLETVKADLSGYGTSKGTVRFTLDHPLPPSLVKKIVRARIAELKAQDAGTLRRPHSRRQAT